MISRLRAFIPSRVVGISALAKVCRLIGQCDDFFCFVWRLTITCMILWNSVVADLAVTVFEVWLEVTRHCWVKVRIGVYKGYRGCPQLIVFIGSHYYLGVYRFKTGFSGYPVLFFIIYFKYFISIISISIWPLKSDV